MPDIPEEAVQAATLAKIEHAAYVAEVWRTEAIRLQTWDEMPGIVRQARIVAAAAAAAQVRRETARQIADAIEEGDAFSDLGTRTCAWAARIARQIGEAALPERSSDG